jgi:spore coat polysaccharide biosynthesis protein SpsF
MSRAAIFLSIRNKATRLPGKSFLPLAGRPLADQLLARLRHSREAHVVVITTSTHPDDAVFEEVASRSSVEVFRGSEDDKLDRYLAAARAFGVDLTAIVDGDDPLCDPGYIDRLLRAMRQSGADFGSVRQLPVGVTSNVVRVDALEKVCRLKTEHDTEVWGGYFTETGLFKTCMLEADPAHRDPSLRLTLDYPEDYDLIGRIYTALAPHRDDFTLDDVFEVLRGSPELRSINAGAVARYEENLRRITRVGIQQESE